jgi:hypothetical protein
MILHRIRSAPVTALATCAKYDLLQLIGKVEYAGKGTDLWKEKSEGGPEEENASGLPGMR